MCFSSNVSHTDSIISTVLWNSLTAPLTEKIEVLGIATGTIIMPDGNSYQDAVLLSTKKTTVNGPDPIFGNYLTVEEISKQIMASKVTQYLQLKFCMLIQIQV